MTLLRLDKAFLFNPPVRIPKNIEVPFVEMGALQPFNRDVTAVTRKSYKGGMKFLDGDILMARITPSLENGKTSIYRASSNELSPAFGSTEFIVIRGRNGLSDSAFGYYLFTSPEIRNYAIASMNGSSGRQRVQLDSLEALQVELPPLPEQQAIASTLGSLDDKIESNRHLAKLAQQLIRARIDEALGDKLGTVRVPVASLAEFINGGAYTKGASGTGRMVLRISELNSGPGSSTVYNNITVPDNQIAHSGDILMSWSGSLNVYLWFRDDAIINQHIFKVLPNKYPAWLVFYCLEKVMPIFQAIAKDKATTMGHIKREHLKTTRVDVPSPEKISALSHSLTPLWERELIASQENIQLAALRDTLLPELLSGRIRTHLLEEITV